ncbi:hypothetical protein TNCV_1151071 [Trichonephila clavipes]|nr:hypothetical protein TNCV_1151071 [Trichonephila clavipes]
MILSGSLPQINLGAKGLTQGSHHSVNVLYDIQYLIDDMKHYLVDKWHTIATLNIVHVSASCQSALRATQDDRVSQENCSVTPCKLLYAARPDIFQLSALWNRDSSPKTIPVFLARGQQKSRN